jgi:S-(hydroxymethyl)glutathione dehydrogenase / alcohol dehydrogenase
VLFAARVQPSSSVVVVGAGGVGQFVVQGARLAGAETVVSVDPVVARREQALQLGATAAVGPEDLKSTMRELLPEGADYAFDAVGAPETTGLALRWTRSGGSCVVVGLPSAGARLDLDPGEFNRREKWLTGTMYGSEDPAVALPILLEHVRAGRLALRPLLGPSFPLERINDAIEASLAGSAGRVVVQP